MKITIKLKYLFNQWFVLNKTKVIIFVEINFVQNLNITVDKPLTHVSFFSEYIGEYTDSIS